MNFQHVIISVVIYAREEVDKWKFRERATSTSRISAICFVIRQLIYGDAIINMRLCDRRKDKTRDKKKQQQNTRTNRAKAAV